MILPFLKGIPGFYKAPFTWMLVILNIAVFLANVPKATKAKTEFNTAVENEVFLRSHGRTFSKYIFDNPEDYSQLMFQMASEAHTSQDRDKIELMGRMALRDSRFMTDKNLTFEGRDDVARKHWKRQLASIRSAQNDDPNYAWGLHLASDWTNWVTYQFLHGSVTHLLGNMFFLLIFGAILEPILGSIQFLLVYLCSGILAAGAFWGLSGISAVPLVGASGSVSGLIGLFASLYVKRSVRFVYWVLPIQKYYGFIYLPSWVALLFWFVSDLAGYMGSLAELGGVAHAAHLGGTGVGVLAGLFLLWSKASSQRVLSQTSRVH